MERTAKETVPKIGEKNLLHQEGLLQQRWFTPCCKRVACRMSHNVFTNMFPGWKSLLRAVSEFSCPCFLLAVSGSLLG
jgi:hypothetical protein